MAGDALHQADEDAPQHRPGDGADAPQHGSDKGLEPQHRAHVGLHLGVGGAVHHRRHGRQAGADSEGKADGLVGADAHEDGRLAVLRHRPHSLAHPGLFDEQLEGHHQRHRHDDGEDADAGKLDAANGHRRNVKNGAHRPGGGGKEDKRQVLETETHRDGGDEHRKAGRPPQRLVSDLLGQNADGAAHRHRRQDTEPGGDPQVGQEGGGEHHHVSPHHDKIAVGKVDEFDDAVDHGIPQGHQGIDAPHLYPVDELLDEYDQVHAHTSLYLCFFGYTHLQISRPIIQQ